MVKLTKKGLNGAKRHTLGSILALTALCISPLTMAQDTSFPSKAMTILVPATTGGMSDTIARLVAEELKNELGQPVIVENHPGASGMISSRNLSQSKPDGYTIGIGYTAFLTAPVIGNDGIQYDPIKDFSPVSQLSDSVGIIISKGDSPHKTWKELFDASKKEGKPLTVGIPGYGSSPHFYIEAISQETGLNMDLIPYRGDVPIMTDVIGGTLDLGVITPVAAKPMIENGRLRALAITNPQRTPALPDVPTIGELGLPTLGGATTWIGVFAPANTPAPVVDKLSQVLQKMMQRPEIKERFIDSFGMTPVGNTAEEFKSMLERDYTNWIKARDTYNISVKK